MEIKSRFDHFNINVLDLERSIAFYNKALGLKDRNEPYELGDNESHLCFRVAGDYDEVRKFHKEMDCVCYENTAMGLYFINDPDDYWIEILPAK